jgi:hypothetical protein
LPLSLYAPLLFFLYPLLLVHPRPHNLRLLFLDLLRCGLNHVAHLSIVSLASSNLPFEFPLNGPGLLSFPLVAPGYNLDKRLNITHN